MTPKETNTYEGKEIIESSIEPVNGWLKVTFADDTFAVLTPDEVKAADLTHLLPGDEVAEEGNDEGASSDDSGEGAPNTEGTELNPGTGAVGPAPEGAELTPGPETVGEGQGPVDPENTEVENLEEEAKTE